MDEPTSVERWLPIPGFGRYQVSDHGRVWSSYRGGKLLKPFPARDGYPQVQLVPDAGEHVSVKLHRLVLETFVGNCPMGMEACHEDDDHLNVRLDNLRWATRGANMLDRRRNRGHGSGMTHLELCEARRVAVRSTLSDQSIMKSPDVVLSDEKL